MILSAYNENKEGEDMVSIEEVDDRIQRLQAGLWALNSDELRGMCRQLLELVSMQEDKP